MKKPLSTATWAQLVKERDERRCQHDGCTETSNLEAHHIVPVSQGGPNTPENGITLCREHHTIDNVRIHNRSRTQSKTDRIFAKRKTGKREAAYRFLSKKRLMETARPRGPWRPDEED
ncbi:MAG: HNH endonuclease [Candidatus Latescibacteria bacterium]|jgi:5-methylcytosine-specific restriction endonuclease McrA|nr:HNH endonuclease [Candidatus Latescibacterota bacterium]